MYIFLFHKIVSRSEHPIHYTFSLVGILPNLSKTTADFTAWLKHYSYHVLVSVSGDFNELSTHTKFPIFFFQDAQTLSTQ